MYVLGVQEQFCFGEEIAEVMSFETLAVNITRSVPACNQASVFLHLSYEHNGRVFGKLNYTHCSS